LGDFGEKNGVKNHWSIFFIKMRPKWPNLVTLLTQEEHFSASKKIDSEEKKNLLI
jgi:hypothetical protein